MAKATERQLIATNILMQHGLSSSGAIAVVANYCWEAGGNGSLPTKFRTSNLDHGSNGLAQWRLSRLTNYMKFVAAKHPDLDQDDFSPEGDLWAWFGRLDYQLEFTVVELQTTQYQALYAKLRKGGDIAGLVADFCWQYERPNVRLAHLAERVAFGKSIAAGMVSSPIPTDVTTHIAASAHASDKAQSQSAIVTSAGAIGIAGVGGYHLHLSWWLWMIVIFSVVIFVAGMISLVKSHIDATNVKSTAPAVTPDATPAVPMKPAPEGPAATTVTNDKAQRRRRQAKLAAEGVPTTLAAALKQTPEGDNAAHAEVEQLVK